MVWHLIGLEKSRSFKPILVNFLCYEGGWTPPFGASSRGCPSALSDMQRINIGCSLRDSIFEVPCRTDDEGRPLLANAPFLFEDSRPLLKSLLRLLKQLQPPGSVRVWKGFQTIGVANKW